MCQIRCALILLRPWSILMTTTALKKSESQKQNTVHKRRLDVLAQKSENIFRQVVEIADNINMKVNSRKTQMLCVNACKNNTVTSHIYTDAGERINSSDSLRVLGFDFSAEPNAIKHVSGVIDRLYGKLWTLRFLKRSGMSESNLLSIYKDVLRPSVENSSTVYHTLIPDYVAEKLESVQKQAMKVIYGWNCNYGKLVEDGRISSLSSRREEAMLKFANKVAKSPRFGPIWFKETTVQDREVRPSTRNKYVERLCRTERGRNNPIVAMTRILNEQHRANTAETPATN